jgi:hypothetical protein
LDDPGDLIRQAHDVGSRVMLQVTALLGPAPSSTATALVFLQHQMRSPLQHQVPSSALASVISCGRLAASTAQDI